MDGCARHATPEDLIDLIRLYRLLETEMLELKPVWRLTEGLPEPAEEAFEEAFADTNAGLYLGTFDGVPVGFLLGRSEPLLPQADSERVAAVRLVFTEEGFRELGVGEAMMARFMADHDDHRFFDAHVSPGHRIAKNFFEANGFKARHIVMHHDAGGDG